MSNIYTLYAKIIFKYLPLKKENESAIYLNLLDKYYLSKIVKHVSEFDECPLYHQIIETIIAMQCGKEKAETDKSKEKIRQKTIQTAQTKEDWFFDKLLFVDFEDIFMIPVNETDIQKERREFWGKCAKILIEKGLDIRVNTDKIVHFVPFDKSGNMSRNSRISFISEELYESINHRLNLDIDFEKQVKVKLSKYYAYRGLYLSTSKRVESSLINLTEETVIVVPDERKDQNGDLVLGPSYDFQIPIETAEQGEIINGKRKWNFVREEYEEFEYVKTPFDGEGFISPEWSKIINEQLKLNGASSYQVRLPFTKGMLHQVNYHKIIEHRDDINYANNSEYMIKDAFGIERDLKKAQIILTESMFKAQNWLGQFSREEGYDDPMAYYFNKLKDYNHALYISGTDLPYGHTTLTQLSYQTINTLKFTEESFDRVVRKHTDYITNPINYIKDRTIETSEVDAELICDVPNWKKALISNEDYTNDVYIKEQVSNTQKGMLTKLVDGKVVVNGQTRFLCRDLLPLLASLLKDDKEVAKFYNYVLKHHFFMPKGENILDNEDIVSKENNGESTEGYLKLYYSKYYAFFRNPHLSRNEQCMLHPLVKPTENEEFEPYIEHPSNDGGKWYGVPNTESFGRIVDHYNQYFGHLTGVVMFPRGSSIPLCLGGADFDGDLISVVFDEDVVDAVDEGVYKKDDRKWTPKRKLSVIKIPSTGAKDDYVPKYVQIEHLEDTFSNSIGLLSNTAIAIGQREYSRNKTEEDYSFDSEKATCAKCTLLTGLEIDAAKNGIHPDLSIVINTQVGESEYLKFHRDFAKLRSNNNYRFYNLKVEKKDVEVEIQKGIMVNEKAIVASAKNCSEEAAFILPEDNLAGTYINLLPDKFVDAFNVYKKQKHSKKKLKYSFKSIDHCGELEKDFKYRCNEIMDLYYYYAKYFFPQKVREEKDRQNFGERNLAEIIHRQYDFDNAERFILNVVPTLIEKIRKYVPSNKQIKLAQKRMNDCKWQFVPMKDRERVLSEIVGIDYSLDALTDDEKQLLFHFGQDGYKTLWHILTLIAGMYPKSYEDLKQEYLFVKNLYCAVIRDDEGYKKYYDTFEEKEQKEEGFAKKFNSLVESNDSKNLVMLNPKLDELLDKAVKTYYEENLVDIEEKLYQTCLCDMYFVINDSKLDASTKIGLLHEITKDNAVRRKFFWDVFEWKDLSEHIS